MLSNEWFDDRHELRKLRRLLTVERFSRRHAASVWRDTQRFRS
jgi:hypothetical protein